MSTIEFKSASKQYHKREFFFAKSDLFWAIKDVTFSVRQGETISLIGPNGAGKTTIVKLISKITYPTEGSISVRGRVVPLITMESCLNPFLNVRENTYLLMSIFGLKKRDRKKAFNEIIEFSELKDFLDMPIKKFSNGMITRLSFSIAVHVPSEILLIDEVLAVGDQQFQRKCLNKINAFKKVGKTIIFVSHDLENIKRISNRVIWLDKGRILEQGLPDRVITSYLKATY